MWSLLITNVVYFDCRHGPLAVGNIDIFTVLSCRGGKDATISRKERWLWGYSPVLFIRCRIKSGRGAQYPGAFRYAHCPCQPEKSTRYGRYSRTASWHLPTSSPLCISQIRISSKCQKTIRCSAVGWKCAFLTSVAGIFPLTDQNPS